MTAVIAILLSCPVFASVHPTSGWRVSGNGVLLSTGKTGGLGYGFELGGYIGADVNRWSQFFGEISLTCNKSEFSSSRFSSLKPPSDIFLGCGWCFSPGAGWSISFSGGFAAMLISYKPDVWATGMYAEIVPRWSMTGFEESPFYNFSVSFPVQVAFSGNTLHVRAGIALGADVSIYQTRRGNSFTEATY